LFKCILNLGLRAVICAIDPALPQSYTAIKQYLGLNHCQLVDCDYLEMSYWNANLNKNLQETRIKPIVQLWKYCYRRNKSTAGESSCTAMNVFFHSCQLINFSMPNGVKTTPSGSLFAHIFTPACFLGKSSGDFLSFLGPHTLLGWRAFMLTLNMIFLIFTSNARRSHFDFLYGHP